MAASDSSTLLSASDLEQKLAGQLIGQRVILLATTTSTNDAALRMANDGCTEGLVVIAEEQTAGRGQRGHSWESASGKGLWLSIVLYPDISVTESARLTDWAAQGIATTIEQELSLPATIKPPNDIFLRDRKVAGVLVEMRARRGASHIAIVGLGINIDQRADDFSPQVRATAISLSTAASRPVERLTVAVALLRELNRTYPAARA